MDAATLSLPGAIAIRLAESLSGLYGGSVRHVKEEIDEAVKLIPQERKERRNVEHGVDVSVRASRGRGR